MSKLGAILGGIVEPINAVATLVDSLHTSQEEKTNLKLEYLKTWIPLYEKAIDAEVRTIEARAKIIEAEAKTGGLAASWRPILMLSLTAILVNNYLVFPYLSGVTDVVQVLEFPAAFWTLLTVGVGAYITGRSGEKMVDKWKNNKDSQ